MESPHETRSERTRDALAVMGVSITAGGITTVLSATALWATTSVFFQKFAYLVTVTILSAFLWSMIFFTAFCATFGPENNRGSIEPFLNWLRELVTCKKCKGRK